MRLIFLYKIFLIKKSVDSYQIIIYVFRKLTSNISPIGNKIEDCKTTLKTIRQDSDRKLVIAYLNINSLQNKFDLLSDQIKGTIDILMISETKIDDSFPTGNFFIDGFSTPFWSDRDANEGRIMLYVREDIPANRLATKTKNAPLEGLHVELDLRNTILNSCSVVITIHTKTW